MLICHRRSSRLKLRIAEGNTPVTMSDTGLSRNHQLSTETLAETKNQEINKKWLAPEKYLYSP